jgi:hypothetical protein
MGGVVSVVTDDILGIDDSGGIVGSVSEAGADLDDFVNEEIPGGWTTVAVVAGGTALALQGAGTAAAGTAAGAAEGAAAAGGIATGTGATVFPVAVPGAITATPIAAGTVGIPAAAGTAAAGAGLLSGAAGGSTAIPGSLQATLGELGVQTGSSGALSSAATGTAGGGFFPGVVEGATATYGPGSLQSTLGELGVNIAGGATYAPGTLGAALPGLGVTPLASGGVASGVTQLSNGSFLDQAGRLFNQAGDFVKQLTGSELNQILGSAAQTYINQSTLSNIANQQRQLGAQAAAKAEQLGAAAAVPFTPYTVTTGLGSAQVTPTGATTTLAAPYQTIAEQTAQQAGQAFGAINPAQSAQTLYGQLEALQAPGRQIEQNRLLGNLGQKGLLGFSQNLPTVGGAVTGVNPYFQSLLSAQETARAQNALAAQQYGTSEAQRQAALGSSLLGVGTGLEAQAAQRLGQAGTLGVGLTQLGQTDAANALKAGLTGLGYQTAMNLSAADIEALRQRQLAQAASGTVGDILGTVGGSAGSIGNLINAGTGLFSAGSTYNSIANTPLAQDMTTYLNPSNISDLYGYGLF